LVFVIVVLSVSSFVAAPWGSGPFDKTERRELSLVQGAHAAPRRVSLIQTDEARQLFRLMRMFISCVKRELGNKIAAGAV
jgi:hypothetical protein